MIYQYNQHYENGMFVREYLTEPDAPLLLYIHGLGESGLCFEQIVHHELLHKFNHLIPDLPGYGRSLWTEPYFDFSRHIDHLADWLMMRQSPQCFIVGHSLGGVLGLLLCERFQDIALGLIDIEGNKSRADCTFSGNAASYQLADFISYGFDKLRDDVIKTGVTDKALRGYYASMRFADPLTFYENSVELVKLSESGTLADRLRTLCMPILYIAGYPEGASERSLEILKAAEVPTILIEPSGHWPFIDQPDAFAQALSDFINKNKD